MLIKSSFKLLFQARLWLMKVYLFMMAAIIERIYYLNTVLDSFTIAFVCTNQDSNMHSTTFFVLYF